MTLTPWRNLWELRFPTLKDEMDKLFEDFFGRTGFPSITEGGWLPSADVHETKKDVVVALDLPAINPKEVSISIVDDRLIIKGERKKEEETKEENYYKSERVYGTFQRVIQLPTEVVGNKAKATYKDGVLKIIIPKSQKAVPKEIKVEVE
jgi:HSP20 family protein